MAHTRSSTGGEEATHAPDVFAQIKAKEKYGGSKAVKKPQPPANAPGQGHHHGGGYTPGATAGNLVTKGNLNIPSGMYKAYNVKPYIGRTHLYGPPPINLGMHAPGHGPQAAPATDYSDMKGTKSAPKGAVNPQQGFLGKNELRPASGPSPVKTIGAITGTAAIWWTGQLLWRAGVALVYGAFRLTPPWDVPDTTNATSSWEPTFWQVPPGTVGEPPFPEPPPDFFPPVP